MHVVSDNEKSVQPYFYLDTKPKCSPLLFFFVSAMAGHLAMKVRVYLSQHRTLPALTPPRVALS